MGVNEQKCHDTKNVFFINVYASLKKMNKILFITKLTSKLDIHVSEKIRKKSTIITRAIESAVLDSCFCFLGH